MHTVCMLHTGNSGDKMNVIFDIGNVICEWDPGKLTNKVITSPDQQKEMLDLVFRHSDWHELDKGTITLETAIANAVRRSSRDPGQIEALYRGTPASLVPKPEIIETIHDLASRGFPLYVLSNMQRHAWEYLSTRYSFWTVFKGIVVSCQINLIKPDPEIFRYIIGRYALAPADTLFLDDMMENINAASAFGLNTIHVVNTDDYITRLYNVIGVERH